MLMQVLISKIGDFCARTYIIAEKIRVIYINTVFQNSSVGIATGYELDDRGVEVRVQEGSRIFSSPRRLDRL
jgi:hypothetical protein